MDNFSRSRQDIAELLQEHGLTATSQRLDIGQVLLNKPQHLSADEIIKKVNVSSARVSKATVYNTLKTFRIHGLISEVKVTNQYLIYDSVVEDHHHVYNEDTGELFNLDLEQVRIDEQSILKPGLVKRGVEVLIRVGNS